MLGAMGQRIAAGLVLIAMAATAAAGPGSTPLPRGPSLNPHTHGFMLYISQPLGGGPGVGGPRFGLRFEQVHMGGNNGAPDAGNPMQHRSIIGWQFGGAKATDVRLELGGRVTYDLRAGGFALARNQQAGRLLETQSLARWSFAHAQGSSLGRPAAAVSRPTTAHAGQDRPAQPFAGPRRENLPR